MLTKFFSIKDIGETSFALGIKYYKDRSHCVLGLSHEAYNNRAFEIFDMHTYKLGDSSFTKR